MKGECLAVAVIGCLVVILVGFCNEGREMPDGLRFLSEGISAW